METQNSEDGGHKVSGQKEGFVNQIIDHCTMTTSSALLLLFMVVIPFFSLPRFLIMFMMNM